MPASTVSVVVVAAEDQAPLNIDAPTLFEMFVAWFVRLFELIWNRPTVKEGAAALEIEPGVSENTAEPSSLVEESDSIEGLAMEDPQANSSMEVAQVNDTSLVAAAAVFGLVSGAEAEWTGEGAAMKPAAKKKYRAGKQTREKREAEAARKAARDLKKETEEDDDLAGGWQRDVGKCVQRTATSSSNGLEVEETDGPAIEATPAQPDMEVTEAEPEPAMGKARAELAMEVIPVESTIEVTQVEPATKIVQVEQAMEVPHAEPATEATSATVEVTLSENSGEGVVTQTVEKKKKKKSYRAGKKAREKKDAAALRKAAREDTNEGGWKMAVGKRIKRESRSPKEDVAEEMNESVKPQIARLEVEPPNSSPEGATHEDTQEGECAGRTKREINDDSTTVDGSAAESSETTLSDEEPTAVKEISDDGVADDESPKSPTLAPLNFSPILRTEIEPQSEDQDGSLQASEDLVVELPPATPGVSPVVQVVPRTRRPRRFRPVIPLPWEPLPVAEVVTLTTDASTQTEMQEEPEIVEVAEKEEMTKSIAPIAWADDPELPPIERPVGILVLNEENFPCLRAERRDLKISQDSIEAQSTLSTISISPVLPVVVNLPQIELPNLTQLLNEVDSLRPDSERSNSETSEASLETQSLLSTTDDPLVFPAVVHIPQAESPKSTQELHETEQPVVTAEPALATIIASPRQTVLIPSCSVLLRPPGELHDAEYPPLGAKSGKTKRNSRRASAGPKLYSTR